MPLLLVLVLVLLDLSADEEPLFDIPTFATESATAQLALGTSAAAAAAATTSASSNAPTSAIPSADMACQLSTKSSTKSLALSHALRSKGSCRSCQGLLCTALLNLTAASVCIEVRPS
jgi:hypothetical protein